MTDLEQLRQRLEAAEAAIKILMLEAQWLRVEIWRHNSAIEVPRT